jgi:hypothetical protein
VPGWAFRLFLPRDTRHSPVFARTRHGDLLARSTFPACRGHPAREPTYPAGTGGLGPSVTTSI